PILDEYQILDITLKRRIKRNSMNPAMQSIFLVVLCFLLLSCSERDQNEEIKPKPSQRESSSSQLVDAYGDTVQIGNRAKRVISLAPNITEIIYFLKGESQLVARTDYCDYPPAALQLPSVGTLGSY